MSKPKMYLSKEHIDLFEGDCPDVLKMIGDAFDVAKLDAPAVPVAEHELAKQVTTLMDGIEKSTAVDAPFVGVYMDAIPADGLADWSSLYGDSVEKAITGVPMGEVADYFSESELESVRAVQKLFDAHPRTFSIDGGGTGEIRVAYWPRGNGFVGVMTFLLE